MNRLGIRWQRKDQRYDMQMTDEVIAERGTPESNVGSLSAFVANTTVAMLALPASCNVTLVWDAAESELRRLVEGELSQLLPNLRPAENPGVNWLLTAATSLAAIMIFLMAFVIWMTFRNRGSLI